MIFKHAPLKIMMTLMENNFKEDWKFIHSEIDAMLGFLKDESLPMSLRMSIKKDLLEIKHESEALIIELS